MSAIGIVVGSQTRFVKFRLGFRKESASEFIPTSAYVTVKLDNSCANQSLYLTWLNSLGAWEYWEFKQRKDYNIEFDDEITLDKNTFPVWAKDSSDKETERFYQSIRARQGYTVRAEGLSRADVSGVAKIKESIAVQRIFATAEKETVLVDKSDFTIRQDQEKLHNITFDMQASTEIPIQDQ